MLFCEPCRVKMNWGLPGTYPYHDHGQGKCEICNRHNDCYSYPALYMKPRSNWTPAEILLDKRFQIEYREKAESMVLQTGTLNHARSEELSKVAVTRKDGIDWFATYKLRQRIQDGYRKADELNRDRR